MEEGKNWKEMILYEENSRASKLSGEILRRGLLVVFRLA